MGTIPKQKQVNEIARLARTNLKNDGCVAQVAFIWTKDKIAIVGGRPMVDKTDKAAWAAILRRMCVELDAQAILTVMEVWTAIAKKDAPLDDLMGPVKDKIGAYDAIMFHLETMDGTWMCICPIVRSEGQPPSFSLPRQWIHGKTEGILTNFIPDKNAHAYSKSEVGNEE
jgi:hypothetical protein